MTGGRTPETCWAVNKRQDNKLEKCFIWLVIYLNSAHIGGFTQSSWAKWGVSVCFELMLRKQVVVALTCRWGVRASERAVSTQTQCSAKRYSALLTEVWRKARATCSLQTLYSLQYLSHRFGGLETFHDRESRVCFSRTLPANIYFQLPTAPILLLCFLRTNCMKVLKLLMYYERQCNKYRPVFLPIALATAMKSRNAYLCELARRAMYE
jgi:hypothetical protein